MSYSYDQRKRAHGQKDSAPKPAVPGPDLDALMAGRARPSAAQKGRSIDLDAAIRTKMEHAFGDLSGVKLYESPAVGAAGAEAVARGSEIAFAPGMTDFSSRSGQERLGHELSHVMSQRSGAVRGSGFLSDAALEARADREGALAAAGGTVYAGPVTRSLSAAAPAPDAAGPMQAKRKTKKEKDAEIDADNLYGLYGGLNTGQSDESEINLYDNIGENANIELMQELGRRKDKYAKRLRKHRAKLKKKNPQYSDKRLDYIAGFSKPGYQYHAYNELMVDIRKDHASAPGVRQLEQLDKETETPKKTRELRAEAERIMGTDTGKFRRGVDYTDEADLKGLNALSELGTRDRQKFLMEIYKKYYSSLS